MEIYLNQKREICGICHIGRITRKMLTYTERFHEELILIPNIPGSVCPYCGDTQYESFAVNMLYQLLWTDLETTTGVRSARRNYTYHIGTHSNRPGRDHSSPH